MHARFDSFFLILNCTNPERLSKHPKKPSRLISHATLFSFFHFFQLRTFVECGHMYSVVQSSFSSIMKEILKSELIIIT